MKDRYHALWDKISARQDELNKRQEELEAEEDLANFDLTEWKKRFLRWLDGNHERLESSNVCFYLVSYTGIPTLYHCSIIVYL